MTHEKNQRLKGGNMRNFKQVAAMTLAGVMTVSMAGVQTPAATNTTFSKAVSMMDVSNATGSGNVGIDIAGDEVSEKSMRFCIVYTVRLTEMTMIQKVRMEERHIGQHDDHSQN